MKPEEVPFTRLLATLRLTSATRFRHFNHGGVLRGLLSAALGDHDVPTGVVPFACESGRVLFDAGESYRVGFTLVGDARALAESIERGLRKLGGSRATASLPGAPATLAGNFDLIGVQELEPADVSGLAHVLGGQGSVCMRFVSPFRLDRPRDLKAEGRAYVNADCFPPAHVLTRLFKRLFMLASGHYPEGDEMALLPALTGALSLRSAQGLWLDVPVTGDQRVRKERPKGYTLGGFLGTVTFDEVPPAWLPWLALGRFAHAGEATHFGFGRYVFVGDRAADEEAFVPAATHRDRIARVVALERALEHVREKSIAAGVDGQAPAAFADDRWSELPELAQALGTGRYTPDALRGVLARKADGRLRPLAFPTVRDRVAQRATCEAMAPAIDTLLEDCSFAYRKGLSRQSAARAIERAWAEGYRYVLDADISAFFDSVEWEPLFAKLHALFPFEPLVDTIKAWVRAPVVFDGCRVERHQGLPQGTAVSPMLANLFLDELDERLQADGFRLVRYADDFVVLCRDLDGVRDAQEKVRAALDALGLELNERKTSHAAIDAGFTYLGYLFCRSMSVAQPPTEAPMALPSDAVPGASWLAQVPLERVRSLAPGAAAAPKQPATVAPLKPRQGSTETVDRRPLYLASLDTVVRLDHESLEIERPGQPVMRCPIGGLSQVVLCGRIRASLPAVLKIAERGVPVYFCRRTGELVTALTPHAPDWTLWLAQGRLAEDPRARLAFAVEIVAAKLHNYGRLSRRFRLEGSATLCEQLERLAARCREEVEVAAVTGYEGEGAAQYFAAMGATLDPGWRFTGRRRRPAPDPINSLLSFGYTVLYHHVSTELVAAGLNPRLGVFHRPRGAHHALASDLVEEFRYLVDGLVWAMVHRREVTPADFMEPTAGGACLMTHEFQRTFIHRLEQRLATLFTHPDGASMSYREAMARQARRFRALAVGERPCYEAFRAAT